MSRRDGKSRRGHGSLSMKTNWRVWHSKAQLERRHVVLSLSRGWHLENSGVESGVLGGRGRGRRNMKGGWRDERKD